MCGIAGIVDLAGGRSIGEDVIQRMTRAIIHRGPDEEGYFQRPGVALGSRRLSIFGLAAGQQPGKNEERPEFVGFNGEFFAYPERRGELKSTGHRLVYTCDAEI